MTASRRRAVAAGIAIAFVVGGLVAEWLATLGPVGLDAAIDLAAGWVLAGAGLAVWLVVPGSRIGVLLMASALGWFVGTVTAPTAALGRSDLGWVAGFLWQLHAGFLVHAVATWPSGRVVRPTQLPLVVGGYIAALFPQLWAEDPGYVVLGALLVGGLLLDQSALAPSRRAAYRPSRVAGLLLAAALAGLPSLARALNDLGWKLLDNPGTLYAATVAIVGLVLATALLQRKRLGAAADLAVELREIGSGSATMDPARLLLAAMGADKADDPDLQRALARSGALVDRNRMLQDHLNSQVRELDDSRRRLVEVGDEERRVLVERLRTGAQGRLEHLAAGLPELAAADGDLPGEADQLDHRISRATHLLDQALAELDGLAAGLDPGRVAERGLDAALRDLAAASPVPVQLTLMCSAGTPLTVATTLYLVASEALANVIRHARAKAASLGVSEGGGRWMLVIEDDGVGGADPARGSGLRGLRERVEAVGGGLVVDARPGGGTRLAASIPARAGAGA